VQRCGLALLGEAEWPAPALPAQWPHPMVSFAERFQPAKIFFFLKGALVKEEEGVPSQ